MLRPYWVDLDAVATEISHDSNLKPIVHGLTLNPNSKPPFALIHGHRYYKCYFVISPTSSWIPQLIHDFHSTPSGVIWGPIGPIASLLLVSIGQGWWQPSRLLLQNVRFVRKISMIINSSRFNSTYSNFQTKLGRTSHWISFQVYQSPKGWIVFWLWWIAFQSMPFSPFQASFLYQASFWAI